MLILLSRQFFPPPAQLNIGEGDHHPAPQIIFDQLKHPLKTLLCA
jgi:hypothetical protein